jgi:hypothetical protein
MVVQETTGEAGDRLGQANPTRSKAKQGQVPTGTGSGPFPLSSG